MDPLPSIPFQALLDASLAIEVPRDELGAYPGALEAVPSMEARFLLIGRRLLAVAPWGCEVLEAGDPTRPYWSAVGPQEVSE